jgi:starch phosphorylase
MMGHSQPSLIVGLHAAVRFGTLQVETAAEQHVFQLADPVHGSAPLRQVMTRGAPIAGATNGYTFRACVPASRPATAYTPRLIPHHPEAAVPLEAAQILWQR